MSWILQKGTVIANPSDIIVVDVAVTWGVTSVTNAADARLIWGRVISTELYPATDIAKINAIPTISSTWVLTFTISTSTVVATAKVTVALKTWNNV